MHGSQLPYAYLIFTADIAGRGYVRAHTQLVVTISCSRALDGQAFLFSALDHEVSRGPVDYRRDWSDEDEGQPR